MVETHVYFRFKAESQTPEFRSKFAERCRALGHTLEIRGMRVGTPADDRSEAAWDLCLILEFNSVDAASTCAAHPDFQALLDHDRNPQLAVTKDWRFIM